MNKVTKVNIWDLDGTVINSFHRVQPCLCPTTGNLDLQKYLKQACSHELVMQDTLLPLVETMRRCFNEANTVNVIVTARTMSKSDYVFLRQNGLRGRNGQNVRVMSRDSLAKYFPHHEVKSIYSSRDADYKRRYFELLLAEYPGAEFTVYDDHKGVLAVAASMGFRVLDAEMVNDILSVGMSLIGEAIIDEHMAEDLDIDYLKAKLDFAWDCMTDEEKAEHTATTSVVKVLAA